MLRWLQRIGLCLFVTTLMASVGCTKQVRTGSSGGGYDLGPYRLSVYWLAHERWYRGPHRASLRVRGRRYAWVSERFARAIRIQGSGILRNGQIVQYSGRCRDRGRLCLRVRLINRRRYPSGVGAAGRPLLPLRSVAVDTRQFAFGTKLYIPQLGALMRARGYRHDGCFIAHDRGSRIKGARIDLFAGHRGIYRRYLKGRLPERVQVYINHPRCQITTAQR